MIKNRSFIVLLICAIVFIGFCICIPGIYFEGGSEIYTYHLVKGNFTSTPVTFFRSFGFFIFTADLLSWSYKFYPNVPWYDLFVVMNITIATALLLLLSHIKRFHWLLLICVAILWLDCILLPEITKYGFWIAFLSLQIFFSDPEVSKKLKVIAFVLFIYSFMIRVESSYLALVCFALYELLSNIHFGSSSLFMVLKKLIPFSFVAFVFYIILNIPFTEQDKIYISFRPYQFTLWDFKQDPATFLLKNSSDSIILIASENHYISDISKINSSFFEKIHLRAKDKKLTSISAYFENPSFLIKKGLSELNSSKYYLISLLAFALAIGLAVSRHEPIQQSRNNGLVIFCSIFLVLFFGFFMKLERHLVFPLITGAVLYLIASHRPIERIRSWVFVLVTLTSLLLLVNICEEYHFYRSNAAVNDELCKDVNVRFPGSIIYIDLYTMVSLHERLFEKETFPYYRAVSFDNGMISYYPEWAQKMERLGQPTSMSALAKAFSSDPNKSIFIFNKGREHLFEKYFLLVYGEKIVFEEISSSFSQNSKYPYSYYRISNSGK